MVDTIWSGQRDATVATAADEKEERCAESGEVVLVE
jgi:hypothetical protein